MVIETCIMNYNGVYLYDLIIYTYGRKLIRCSKN